ncbi:ABC transporter permease [Cohnella panacarvi]|uniref:ABC transporter permease n=1 Tax=Cohnella panacarvi TaxID=400776 RepID=UPI00047E99EB|nr:ABC-2 family transporter protein [Cohnella panacarvi]
MGYLDLYFTFIKLRIMGVAEYRKSFFMGVLAQFFSYASEILLVWLIMKQFKSINGWGAYEVTILYTINLGSYALAGFLFFTPCNQISSMVKNGSFDEVLTKPLNNLLYLICRDFNTAYISHLLLSLFVIAYSLNALAIPIDISSIAYIIVIFLSGALIQAAGLIVTSVPAFWVVENSGIKEIFFFEFKSFVKYPISIYHKSIQIILTMVLPYAFINFFPVQVLLKKNDYVGFNHSLPYISPLVGVFCFTIAYLFWKKGINNYSSTGS